MGHGLRAGHCTLATVLLAVDLSPILTAVMLRAEQCLSATRWRAAGAVPQRQALQKTLWKAEEPKAESHVASVAPAGSTKWRYEMLTSP